MIVEVGYIQLHSGSALFIGGGSGGGINLGEKLDPTKRAGLKLSYDDSKTEFIVELNDLVPRRLPSTSVLSYCVATPETKARKSVETHKNHPMKLDMSDAQIENPTTQAPTQVQGIKRK